MLRKRGSSRAYQNKGSVFAPLLLLRRRVNDDAPNAFVGDWMQSRHMRADTSAQYHVVCAPLGLDASCQLLRHLIISLHSLQSAPRAEVSAMLAHPLLPRRFLTTSFDTQFKTWDALPVQKLLTSTEAAAAKPAGDVAQQQQATKASTSGASVGGGAEESSSRGSCWQCVGVGSWRELSMSRSAPLPT